MDKSQQSTIGKVPAQGYQANYGGAPQQTTFAGASVLGPQYPQPGYQVNYGGAPQQTTFAGASVSGPQYPQPGYQVNYGGAPQQTTFAGASVSGPQYPQPGYQVNYGGAQQQTTFAGASVSGPQYPQPGYQVNYGGAPQQVCYGEPHESWFRAYRRSMPQWESLSAALLIFTSGGISSLMGFDYLAVGTIKSYARLSWYTGVIIGALIAAVLAHKITKRIFNIVASVLVILNGVLFIVDYIGHDEYKIIFARQCDGIAVGLTLITTILAGSEQASKRFRGCYLTVEQSGLILGAFLKITILRTYWAPSIIGSLDLRPNRIQGIFVTILGVIAFITSFFRTIESPVFLLRQNKEHEAIDALRRLYKPKTITNETYQLLNENKILIEEDRSRGSSNISNSIVPIIKMVLFRCFVSMSTVWLIASYTLNVTVLMGLIDNSNMDSLLFIHIFIRLVGAWIASMIMDRAGRRIPSAIALIIGGAILIILAAIKITNNSAFSFLYFLVCMYQLLVGFLAPASTCYLGEAFSVSVKPYCIFVAISVEYILQIIFSLTYPDTQTFSVYSNFFYVLGALQVIYGIAFYFIMPETRQETLRGALKFFEPLFVKS